VGDKRTLESLALAGSILFREPGLVHLRLKARARAIEGGRVNYQRMFELKQEEWIEACKEIDQLRAEIEKLREEAQAWQRKHDANLVRWEVCEREFVTTKEAALRAQLAEKTAECEKLRAEYKAVNRHANKWQRWGTWVRGYLEAKFESQKRVNLLLMKTNGNLIADRECLSDRLARAEKVIEAARELFSVVSLDWYVQQFGRDESPNGATSGVVAKIHNRGLVERIAAAFSKGREALADYERGKESE
jgi:hypothetical protein